jgi:hypothetical protein
LGQLHDDTPSTLFFDLQALALPPFELPIATLGHQVFEKLSLDNRRPLMIITSLNETAHGLSTSVEKRNRLIASYLTARISPDDLLPLYFGIPQGSTHVVNQEYPALIDAIYRQTDDGIFYSKLLCEDLSAHNRGLARRFKHRFGKDAPGTMDKPDFTTPESEGLFPDDADYADWFSLFRKAKTDFASGSHRARSRIISMFFSNINVSRGGRLLASRFVSLFQWKCGWRRIPTKNSETTPRNKGCARSSNT